MIALLGGPFLLILAVIAWVRRATGRPLISRVPALRTYHILMVLGTPSFFSTFMCVDSHGSFLHRAPLFLLCGLSWLATIASCVRGLSIYRQVRAARGLACLRCLYTVSVDGNRCPECGLEYTSADVRHAWQSERVPFDINVRKRDHRSR